MAASAATLASAAGFGGGSTVAVLGQPLAFVTQVRLDPGESLEPGCVAAVVMAGERLLPAAQVRTHIDSQGEGSARIRVATATAMEEPVIDIRLTVGCAIRVSRNFIVLVDPPDTTAAAGAAVAAVPAFALAPVEAERLAASPGFVARAQPPGALQAAAAVAPPPAVAAVPVAAPTRTPPAAPRSAAPPARAEPVPPPTRAAPRPQRATQRRAETAAPRAAPRTPAPPSAGMQRVAAVERPPRLQLDFVEPPPSAEAAAVEAVESALQAVAEAASAVRAQAAAASATAARMAALEREIERLGGEARSSREEAALLRAEVENAGAGRWLLPLTVLVLLLSALTAWLAWRLTSLQRESQQRWHDALVAPAPPAAPAAIADSPSRQATSPIPFVTSEIKLPPPAAGGRKSGVSAWPPAVAAAVGVMPVVPEPGEELAVERTEVLAPSLLPDAGTPRDVSIEELIDLEQQAEFFVVLGQDEAAVDLLMQHLRDTGGGSPLPYLKLLEIHHRSGDRHAYERMRVRFNQRFNAYAPDWGADLQAGRSLEDYAGTVPRLQQVWARPLDAMAELEALLFRKSRGELFDLPAYREVLFLYALARDLLDREAVDPHHVDLLLPLPDGGEFSSTAPAPFMDMAPGDVAGHPERDAPADRPNAPVDLDLSQSPPPTSIFDLPVESQRAPRP